MKPTKRTLIRDLIDRVSRLSASDERGDDLNPTQWVALSYLARANRFSRAPSQVADFMSATRGTVSQTLKSLARKGLIEEIRSETDKRWISYAVTKAGRASLNRKTLVDEALSRLDDPTVNQLAGGLEQLVRELLEARDQRAFGICSTCRHHESRGAGGYCTLLEEPLSPTDGDLICFEHSQVA